MSVLCEKCKYEFTEMELMGHVSSELYTLYKANNTPPVNQENKTKSIQNGINKLMVGFMNNQKIPCPKCKQYINWIPSRS
ncbi:MAG: hypothetical protein WC747_04205 [Candidatus Babeliales bacterium]|jgi:hypothetical protein